MENVMTMTNGFAEMNIVELCDTNGGEKSVLEKACNAIGAAAHYTYGFAKDYKNFGSNWKTGFNEIRSWF